MNWQDRRALTQVESARPSLEEEVYGGYLLRPTIFGRWKVYQPVRTGGGVQFLSCVAKVNTLDVARDLVDALNGR